MNDATENTREIMNELYKAVDKCEDSLPNIVVKWMLLQKDPVYIKRFEHQIRGGLRIIKDNLNLIGDVLGFIEQDFEEERKLNDYKKGEE